MNNDPESQLLHDSLEQQIASIKKSVTEQLASIEALLNDCVQANKLPSEQIQAEAAERQQLLELSKQAVARCVSLSKTVSNLSAGLEKWEGMLARTNATLNALSKQLQEVTRQQAALLQQLNVVG